MTRTRRLGMTLALIVIAAATIDGGGWAVLTVEDLPERIVASEPVTLRFSVRQHGMRLMAGLDTRVDARLGGRFITGPAAATETDGYYAATLTFPQPGDWSVRIWSGFNPQFVTLKPLKVVTAASPVVPVAPAARGEALFVAKGCASCHSHAAIGLRPVGPLGADLTKMRYPDEYLAKLLADPSFLPAVNGAWTMPNLNLRPAEIAALTAFINKPRKTTN